jgi:hypothetical protein
MADGEELTGAREFTPRDQNARRQQLGEREGLGEAHHGETKGGKGAGAADHDERRTSSPVGRCHAVGATLRARMEWGGAAGEWRQVRVPI